MSAETVSASGAAAGAFASNRASESLAERGLYFVIDEMHGALAMVELGEDAPPPSAEEEADAVAVLAVPLRSARLLSMAHRRFRHSVVVMVDSRTPELRGWLTEFTNKGVFMSRGRLVRRTGRAAGARSALRAAAAPEGSGIVNFPGLPGFWRCRLSYGELIELNRRFEAAAPYSLGAHDCHAYHRSVLATALLPRAAGPVYNFRAPPARGESRRSRMVRQACGVLASDRCREWYALEEGTRVRDGAEAPEAGGGGEARRVIMPLGGDLDLMVEAAGAAGPLDPPPWSDGDTIVKVKNMGVHARRLSDERRRAEERQRRRHDQRGALFPLLPPRRRAGGEGRAEEKRSEEKHEGEGEEEEERKRGSGPGIKTMLGAAAREASEAAGRAAELFKALLRDVRDRARGAEPASPP